MAKEPQNNFLLSDDLRDKLRISFDGAQSSNKTIPDVLERYLVIGFALGSLHEYDLLPVIKGNMGTNWIPFFIELWKKVTNPGNLGITIRLYDDSFIRIPYRVLNSGFTSAMNLFELYALQGGRQFGDFSNLNEAYYYYSHPNFEKLINRFLIENERYYKKRANRPESFMEEEEYSYEEPASSPFVPESASASGYMSRPTYASPSGYMSNYVSGYTPTTQQTSVPEPEKVDKVPKENIVLNAKDRKRQQDKQERKEKRIKRKERTPMTEIKDEIKRLKKEQRERVKNYKSQENLNEDKPLEISSEKETIPKKSENIRDDIPSEQESESELEMETEVETDFENDFEAETETDFETNFEKKPLETMARRSKRIEREEKRKQELAKPRENRRIRETDRKRTRNAKKIAKEIYPEIKKMQEKVENGFTDDMEITETKIKTKPERKEKIIMNDEKKIQMVNNYMNLLDKLFEVNHEILNEKRFHEARAIYNRDLKEEFQRIIEKPAKEVTTKEIPIGAVFSQSPLIHYFYLGDNWWYNASLSDKEILIINFLKRFEGDEERQELLTILKNVGLEDYLKKEGTPLIRELAINDIKPFQPEDRDKNFLWNGADRDIAVGQNAVLVRIPGIIYNGTDMTHKGDFLFYKIIPNLPTK